MIDNRPARETDVIEITPEMIEAGIRIVDEIGDSVTTGYLVEQVYKAMLRAKDR